MGQMSKIHPLDKLISDDSLFYLEAIVPFIEFPYKKMLVMYITYREFISIMNSLNNRDFISSCGFDCHPKSTEEMLAGMCEFLPGNISASMKQMKQMMGMMDMMNSMSATSEPNDVSNPSSSSSAGNAFNSDIKSNKNHQFENISESESIYDSVLSILDNENLE